MATSVFFNQVSQTDEQRLVEDLVVEMIKIHGINVYYLPRTSVYEDPILTEDTLSKFDSAYYIEMYPQSVQGFGGQGDVLTKFGLEIRDQYTFFVAHKRFSEEISAFTTLTRPREGDLIFFDHLRDFFQITYVSEMSPFFQLGSAYSYELTCEKFEYSSERFSTGVAAIDALQTTYSLDHLSFAITDEAGDWLTSDDNEVIVLESFDLATRDTQGSQNDDFESEGVDIVDFSERDPFSEGTY